MTTADQQYKLTRLVWVVVATDLSFLHAFDAAGLICSYLGALSSYLGVTARAAKQENVKFYKKSLNNLQSLETMWG